MTIKILDSWLRDYLKTEAKPEEIAQCLSLTSVSVERVEKYGKNDFLYEIEVTTNRPDLMSVIGLAREAASSLLQSGIKADLLLPDFQRPRNLPHEFPLEIKINPALVNKVCAAVLTVKIAPSPSFIKERLESSGIRSLNNVIDITNYVMRITGHPTHVFDFDRLNAKILTIRESKKGEEITTLDNKKYILPGGDIIAQNEKGEIVDLIGIIELANSIVTEKTKKIMLFVNNNEPYHIRRTSMNLGIRTEAAILNEKNISPQLSMDALLAGINLYEKFADGKIISGIADIYPNKQKINTIKIALEKINRIIGIEIKPENIERILASLGFKTKIENGFLFATPPYYRANDIEIEEDIVEEIARIYGYQRLPSTIAPLPTQPEPKPVINNFYWEDRVRDILKYQGFTEVYTSPLVSEQTLEGPTKDALSLANPLNENLVYLRKSLVPSLLQTVRENKTVQNIKIFELANVYIPRNNDLPWEIMTLAGVVKSGENIDAASLFFEIKGLIEEILQDLGIKNPVFRKTESGAGADVFVAKDFLGRIEILEENLLDFEFNFEIITKYASSKKTYTPVSKFPPIIEDISAIFKKEITYDEIVSIIKKQSSLIKSISLLDVYGDKKTFRILYQDQTRNLSDQDIKPIRQKIILVLEKEAKAKVI